MEPQRAVSPEQLKERGLELRRMGRLDEAVEAQQRAIDLRPDYAEAYFHLGNALQSRGSVNEAIGAFQTLVKLQPALAEGFINLGNALLLTGELDAADQAYRRALELNPNLPRAHANRALLLLKRQQLDEAAQSCERAIALAPHFPEAHNSLGGVLLRQGLIDEALAAFRQALSLAPEYGQASSNLLFAMHCHPRLTPRQIREAHEQWAQQLADPLTSQAPPHSNGRDPKRRLRIAYVSSDLRDHPVGQLSVPLFAGHDHEQFEVHCFCDVHTPDDVTRQLMRYADRWHRTTNQSDEQVAQRIRAAQIDIVIDLALHSAGNRLLALARKPAPVQITYLAYPGTSGMRAMDYRISDVQLDPEDARQDENYTERPLRLSQYWCYNPPADSPPVNELPARVFGSVTFGCLNSCGKLSEPALLLFSEILDAMEGSRLILHADMGSHRQRILRGICDPNAIDPNRIDFVPTQPRVEHLRSYWRIDIALDSFPYCGGATSCDALWMGVPIVTLAGTCAMSRMGVSLLSLLKLDDLIAQSHGQYIQSAVALARDLDRLAELRVGMRDRIRASPLLDGPGFTRQFEAALRCAWRAYCAGDLG